MQDEEDKKLELDEEELEDYPSNDSEEIDYLDDDSAYIETLTDEAEDDEKKPYGRDAYERLEEERRQKKEEEQKQASKSNSEEDKKTDDNSKSSEEKASDNNTEENKKTEDKKEKNNEANQEVARNSAKSKIENLKSKANAAKHKKDEFDDKVYRYTHPGQVLKDRATNAIKSRAKALGTKATEGIRKGTAALTKKLVTNPYFWIAVGILALFIFILFMFMGAPKNNNNSYYSQNCEVFSISSTSLSKSEFVEKAGAYLSDRGASAETFRENLGLVYSLSKQNGVNPELVVVRAVNEGFSPGNSKYNYWGLGCSNTGGYDACMTFASFKEGLMYFINYVNQYDSVTSLMSRYTYIGKYWYNPGSSSLGGCYYFPYIKQYMSEERAKEVERICSSNNECTKEGGPNCVETTEEDQRAKATRSVYAMADRRQEIFGLAPYECKKEPATCTIYHQGDSRWGKIKLGRSSATMASSGCAVTSIAIGISCANVDVTVDNFDAGVFIKSLNSNNCFTDSGAIRWNCPANVGIVPSLKYISSDSVSGTAADKREKLLSYSQNNHIILTHFQNSQHPRGHYVLFSQDKNIYTYDAKDPNGSLSVQSYAEVDQIVVYEYEPKN